MLRNSKIWLTFHSSFSFILMKFCGLIFHFFSKKSYNFSFTKQSSHVACAGGWIKYFRLGSRHTNIDDVAALNFCSSNPHHMRVYLCHTKKKLLEELFMTIYCTVFISRILSYTTKRPIEFSNCSTTKSIIYFVAIFWPRLKQVKISCCTHSLILNISDEKFCSPSHVFV